MGNGKWGMGNGKCLLSALLVLSLTDFVDRINGGSGGAWFEFAVSSSALFAFGGWGQGQRGPESFLKKS